MSGDEEEEGGYCGDCKFSRGVDEKRDVCRCSKRNPHRDWRYRNNEPCPEWTSVFDDCRYEIAKTLTLKQTGYWVEGTAKLLLWGGDEGEINMDPFHVMSLDEIPGKVNDGRFGCQRILEAECDVYEDYEGTHRFLETRDYGGDELIDARTGV